jgi:flagella basal body P-ring formation protein FlgA
MIPILMLVVAGAACHAVNGERIMGSDLAAAAPDFAAIAPETIVGYAPQPGSRRTLAPAELLRIASANSLEVGHNIAPVCFERALMPLDPAKILDALRTALNGADSEIDVLEFSKYFVPPGRLVFPLESLPSHATARVAIWNGYVESEGRRFPVWARARITVPQTRLVAAVQLRAGQTISAADVRVEETRDFPSRTDPLKSVADAVDHVARRFVDKGAPISAADLMDANDVNRGDTVTVEVQSGGAVLLLPAQADMSGRLGQIIPLRNAASGKVFRAMITGKDKALLDFHSPETYK